MLGLNVVTIILLVPVIVCKPVVHDQLARRVPLHLGAEMTQFLHSLPQLQTHPFSLREDGVRVFGQTLPEHQVFHVVVVLLKVLGLAQFFVLVAQLERLYYEIHAVLLL